MAHRLIFLDICVNNSIFTIQIGSQGLKNEWVCASTLGHEFVHVEINKRFLQLQESEKPSNDEQKQEAHGWE